VTKAKRTIYLAAAAAAAAAALTATFVLPGGATAAATTAKAAATTGSSAPTVTVQVVATGLNVPRGLVYDRAQNRLLIAEAGVASGDTGPCGGGGYTTLCYGGTGSVYSYSLSPNGKSGRIITGLPSFSNSAQNFVDGLEALSLYHGQLTGVFALNGTPTTRAAMGPAAADLGQAVVFGPGGRMTPIADIATEETQLYGSTAASDPWGVTTGAFGTLVANAAGYPPTGSLYGGNDVLWASHGNLSQLVAFPVRTFDGNSVDSAPATVVQGPDGAFYVGELTSYPYYAGAADVWRVVPGQKPTVYASGLSKIIDIAFDPQGRLLVLETGGRLAPTALVRINRDGTQTVLLNGNQINDPCGIVAVNDHTYYITNDGGGVGGDGQLLKVTVSD
jgi:hypothetical protein